MVLRPGRITHKKLNPFEQAGVAPSTRKTESSPDIGIQLDAFLVILADTRSASSRTMSAVQAVRDHSFCTQVSSPRYQD